MATSSSLLKHDMSRLDTPSKQLESEMEFGGSGEIPTRRHTLPCPGVVCCETVSLCTGGPFLLEMGALQLDWNGWQGAERLRPWQMPLGLTLTASVPTRFGIRVFRVDDDKYTMHLIWNRSGFAWVDLTRDEIRNTNLSELLNAIGTDLDSLLGQPY